MKRFLLPTLAFALLTIGCAGGPPTGQRNAELIVASRTGDFTKVVSLISEGADVNATDPEGWTPYLAASAEGNWKVMKLLEEMGARTDPGF